MIDPPTDLSSALDRIADLERLVFSLCDKLAIVAAHLGRLAERRTKPEPTAGVE